MDECGREFDRLCENLRELRIGRGISVEELSEAAGVPAVVLMEIENKTCSDSFYACHLVSLCKYYHVWADALLCSDNADDWQWLD